MLPKSTANKRSFNTFKKSNKMIKKMKNQKMMEDGLFSITFDKNGHFEIGL